MADMADFDCERAYCVIVVPEWERLPEECREAIRNVGEKVASLSQQSNLSIPLSDEVHGILDGFSTETLARMARIAYFAGYWRPSLLPPLFPNNSGQSWKTADVIDQVLRMRLRQPKELRVHEGKLRITYEDKDTWMWEEFGLATEKNLETYRQCGLSFNDPDTFHKSAAALAEMCGDLWPSPEDIPENELYRDFRSQKIKIDLKRNEERHTHEALRLKARIQNLELEKRFSDDAIILGLSHDLSYLSSGYIVVTGVPVEKREAFEKAMPGYKIRFK